MREVGVLEAKTQLSALVEAVSAGGEDVMITRHGKPVARLTRADAADLGRRYSGAELLAMSDALQARIAQESPELNHVTWEEMKEMGSR